MKALIRIIILLSLCGSAYAAGCAGTGACYYLAAAGTNNTSDTTKWWTGTGGTGTNGSVPTSADNAITDAASYATAWTLTFDANMDCKDLTLGNPASGVLTTTAGSWLNVYGSIVIASGVLASGGPAFRPSATAGTKTVTTNGAGLRFFKPNGVGSIVQLLDDLNLNASGGDGSFSLGVGANFDPNGHAVIMSGASSGSGYPSIGGSPTFYDLTRLGTASKNDGLYLNSGFTVSHTFTVTSDSATNRVFVVKNGGPSATPYTITVNGTVSVTSADFRDITGAGAASWDLSAISGGSGNCGGNTGITFSTAQTNYYYKASGNDNWSTTGNWFLGSGGTGGAGRVSLCQDTARFDSGSFGAASMTVTQDMPRIGAMDWTGATNSPTLTTSTAASFFGSQTLISGMTLTASTQAYTYEGRGASTFTSGGKTWAKAFTINAPSGTLTMQDAFLTTGALTNTAGTLVDSGQTVTAASYTPASGSFTTFSGTTVLTGTGTVLTGAGTMTMTGTVKFTDTSATQKTLAGGGKTFGSFWYAPGAGTGTLNVTGSNTFTDFKDDGSAAHSILFTAGTTTTAATWTISGTAGAVHTIGSITASGHTLAKSGGGTVYLDYVSVSYSTGSPASTFHAYNKSTDGGNNVNWSFLPWNSDVSGIVPGTLLSR